MKKLVLISFAVFLVNCINGQIFSEDFETVTDGEDLSLTNWTNIAEVGSRLWQGKYYVGDDNSYAQASAYNSGEENITWLITPGINMDETIDETFSFDVNVGFWKHAGLTVFITDDFTGDVSTTNWNDVTSNFTIPEEPTDTYGNFGTAGTMDISDYNGTIFIAFKYTGDDGAEQTTTFQVDNILVEGTVSIDNVITNELKIYPNPVENCINIETNNKIVFVEILNVIGQQIMGVELETNVATINTESLNKGAYFIKTVDIYENINIEKFIKK